MPGTGRPIVTGENPGGLQGEGTQICDQEHSEEEIVREVYEFAAQQMEEGLSEGQIRVLLTENGLDHESAAIVVTNLTRMRSEAIGAAGKREMLYGALWCVGGTAVTIGTYAAAFKGGPFIIAFGAIIFGAIQFFRGLVQWLRR
jgi:hypothetical protein